MSFNQGDQKYFAQMGIVLDEPEPEDPAPLLPVPDRSRLWRWLGLALMLGAGTGLWWLFIWLGVRLWRP